MNWRVDCYVTAANLTAANTLLRTVMGDPAGSNSFIASKTLGGVAYHYCSLVMDDAQYHAFRTGAVPLATLRYYVCENVAYTERQLLASNSPSATPGEAWDFSDSDRDRAVAQTATEAVTVYAAPDGAGNGDGTENDPVSLSAAFQGYPVKATADIVLLPGTYTLVSDTDFILTGIRVSGAGAVVDVGAFDLRSYAADVTWLNVEILSTSIDRASAQAGSAPTDVALGGFEVYGANTVVQGCVVHDVAIFYFSSDGGSILNTAIFYIGWDGPDRGHGHLYIQNAGANPITVEDTAIGADFGWGVHGYAEGGKVDGLHLTRVAQLDSEFVIGGGKAATVVDDIVLTECVLYGSQAALGYVSNTLGSLTLTDNHLVNAVWDIREGWNSLIETGTLNDGDAVYVWPCAAGSQFIALVVAVNSARARNVTIDLTALALDGGTTYELRSLANWSETQEFAGANSVAINMNTWTMGKPNGWAGEWQASPFPRFGVWMLRPALV